MSAESMVAAAPDFAAIVRQSYARQRLLESLSARLERVVAGEVWISLPRDERYTQQNGFLHAAAITAIADSACGYAALSLQPPGVDVLAVEFKINLLRPAAAPWFLAHGRVERGGRQLTVARAEVFAADERPQLDTFEEDPRRLVATMISTIIARPIPEPGLPAEDPDSR